MNCHHAEDLIQSSLDVPLTPPERVRLDAHLAACPACRRAWDEYRRLSQASAAWVRQPGIAETPPALFTAQVLSRVASRSAARPLWPPLLAWGLVVAMLFAVSPAVSGLMPALPGWRLEWVWPHFFSWGELEEGARALPQQAFVFWEGAGGLIAARWAELLLLLALPTNGLLFLRARRAA